MLNMRVKEVLSKYNVTQIELAERLGINRVSVSRLLSDKNDMRISTLQKIANAIGCNVCELLSEVPQQARKDEDETVITCPYCGERIPILLQTGVQEGRP